MSLGHRVGAPRSGAVALAAMVAASVALPRAQGAQSAAAGAVTCRADTGRTIAGALHGRRIASVRVVTAPPFAIPGAPGGTRNLHVRTRDETVRRQLLFAAGDTVDTLRVTESLRRLRRLRYLERAEVAAMTCAGSDAIDITVLTRDAWSTAPSVKVRGSASAVVGVEERNVLGTGRDAKVYVRSDNAQLGFGVAYSDPWVAGTDVAASISRNAYRDGSDWSGTIGLRERSVSDRWRGDVVVSRSARQSPALVGDTVRRETAALLVGRRAAASPASVTSLLAGVEYGEARVSAGASAAIVGPSAVRREFLGIDAGVARRSTRYDVIDSYLPDRHPAELPVALEGEAVVGVGRDLSSRLPALHADAWLGRLWIADDRLLLSADAWASGYRLGKQWSAGTIRVALGADGAAARGRWSARVAAEQLSDPDPDVRALSTVDATVAALPQRARLAEKAVALSFERDVNLRHLSRSYMLDFAGFGAGSMRWDPAAGGERPSIAALGAGFRLSPTRPGMARIGVDVGFPVAQSGGVGRRPFIAFTISPWLEASRMRDGRRLR